MTGRPGETEATLRHLAQVRSRFALWTAFANDADVRTIAELGVFRGEFAGRMLAGCPGVETYYLIDPWRHLEDWNKPANRDDRTFERIFEQAMAATAEHEHKRVVLRGRTSEVIDRIQDGSLDFAYVDGDHTLRGIAIDLHSVYPKVREGGWIAGDDFSPTIWQHGARFEPTLVFPFAVHFAEATGSRIYGLPYKQFLIEKRPGRDFEFVDLTGKYADLGLLGQARPPQPRGPLDRLRRRRPG